MKNAAITKEEILKPISQYAKHTGHILLLNALADKIDGKITQEELSSQCYLWCYHYALSELEHKPLPVVPDYMAEFYRMKEQVQRRLLEKSSERADKVRNHLRRIYRIQAENKVHKEWLEEMLEYFEKEKKEDKVQTIRRMLYGYA